MFFSKSVCISFDYDNDRQYKQTLRMWNNNSRFNFNFDDKTPNEINSYDYGVIKRALSAKINKADYLLVLVGERTNTRHPNAVQIGEKNWQIWEIKKAKELGKRIVAVKLKSTNDSPIEIKNSGAGWAMSFTLSGIVKALENA